VSHGGQKFEFATTGLMFGSDPPHRWSGGRLARAWRDFCGVAVYGRALLAAIQHPTAGARHIGACRLAPIFLPGGEMSWAAGGLYIGGE
jgi:hypothetical protein